MLLISLILAAAPSGAPSVAVVAHGPAAKAVRSELAAIELPVELRAVDAPQTVITRETPDSDTPARLAAARKAYVSADFATCLRQLEPDDLVPRALAALDRLTAARVLLWRTACYVGSNQPELSRRSAEALVGAQLPIPNDIAVTSPEVEMLLGRTLKTVASLAPVPLVISSTEAVVAVDGRPASCITPCRMELPPGAHVIGLSADGYTPTSRVVTVAPPVTSLDVELAPAEPALAAQQWLGRTARGDAVDSPASLRLLSYALRAPRLILITSDAAAPGVLRAALTLDGTVAVRAEREGDVQGVVKDLLVRGRVVEEAPPLYKRWPFWVAVGAAAVATGVTTAVVVGNQRVVTRVGLAP